MKDLISVKCMFGFERYVMKEHKNVKVVLKIIMFNIYFECLVFEWYFLVIVLCLVDVELVIKC